MSANTLFDNYLNYIHDVTNWQQNGLAKNFAAGASLISLFTIIIPIFIYGISLLNDRLKKKEQLSVEDEGIRAIAANVLQREIGPAPVRVDSVPVALPSAAQLHQERRTPPVSALAFDTCRLPSKEEIQNFLKGAQQETELKGLHDSGKLILFQDEEICECLPVMRSRKLYQKIDVRYTVNNKAIIHQQAMRGCTAAAAAMLIVDHGKEPNIKELISRNLSDKECQDLSKVGLTPVMSPWKDLQSLKRSIDQHGSAIITLKLSTIGAHVVVVDHVSDDFQKVRLRDPFHGWEITVSAKAFLKQQPSGNIIQVANS